MRSCTKGCVRVLPRQSPLGLCRPTLSLHIQDGPAGPGESACIQFGSYLWRASPLRAAFGMLFSTDSLLRKKQPASHLYHKVSQSQCSRGTGLLSCDTFWVQQQHDTATFATKLPGCRAHVAGPPRRTTPCAERNNGTQPMGPAVFLAPPAISLSCPVASNPLVS